MVEFLGFLGAAFLRLMLVAAAIALIAAFPLPAIAIGVLLLATREGA